MVWHCNGERDGKGNHTLLKRGRLHGLCFEDQQQNPAEYITLGEIPNNKIMLNQACWGWTSRDISQLAAETKPQRLYDITKNQSKTAIKCLIAT